MKRLAIATALSLTGLVINYLPVEIFPGMPLIFGNVLSILVAVKFGPAAGAAAGFTGGLSLWRLWNEPFPLSAILFLAEGIWVGHQTNRKQRGPLTSVLLFWTLIGIWCDLIIQLLVLDTPSHLALIILARSLINGLLSGIIVEIVLLIHEMIRRAQSKVEERPAHLGLKSLIVVQLTAMIAVPLLYISTHSINDLRERTLSELALASTREINPLDSEIHSLLQTYDHSVERAASILHSSNLADAQAAKLSRQFARLRERQSNLQRIWFINIHGKTLVCDPPLKQTAITQGENFEPIQPFSVELLAAKSIVRSAVIQQYRETSQLRMYIGVPVFNDRDEFSGFVVGQFDLNEFQRTVNKHKRPDETLVIADAEGNLVADSSLEAEDRKDLINISGRWDYEMVRKYDQSGFYHTQPAYNKTALSLTHTHIFSTSTIPETGWKIWSVRSLDPVSRMLEDIYINYLIVLLLALFLAFALSSLMARWLARPVGELRQNAAQLAAGNWTRPERSRFLTADFESLFRSFSLMAERLESNWNHQQHLLGEASAARGELEATFDAMTDAVAIIDIDDNLVRANRAFYDMNNLSVENSTGRLYTELEHPQGDWESCDACLARREGKHSLVVVKKTYEAGSRTFEVRVDLLYNAEGKRIGAVQVIRDLTEIKAAEAEAERAGSFLRNLVDSAFDVIYATTLEGRFLWANRRASDLYGEDASRLVSQTFLHSIHADDRENARRALEMASTGESQVYECRFETAERGVRHALVTHSPIYGEGTVTAILSIVRDITKERMAAEQAMLNDKLRALGQLASGIAHNFNNSLTAILGYTQMVIAKLSDPVILQYLRTVEMAALDSSKMVQRIQSFARQRHGETLISANLNHIIRDALDLTRSRWRDDARAASLTYDIIFRPEEGVMVRCDPSALREVFVNIIINAIDAMPQGGRLTMTTAVEGSQAVISFSDTGCGIAEDARQRVFDPFFTTKGHEGHGLGLAVAYGIVRRYGGDIEVESESGKGTRFSLKFPISMIPESHLPSANASEIAHRSYVLVVDDEAPIRLLLSNLIRLLGHKVLMAENGLVAMKILEGASFDLVITDLSMPELDGWSLVKEIRNRWPETKVMIITGYGDLSNAIAPGSDKGMADAFISKPFDLSEIGKKINDLLLDQKRIN